MLAGGIVARDCQLWYNLLWRYTMTKSRYKQLNDKDWLMERYCKERLTCGAIAKMLGCHASTVGRALALFGIERRKYRIEQLQNKDWLREQYVEMELSAIKIAQIVGCHADAVRQALERFGIPRRTGGVDGLFARNYPVLKDENWLLQEYVQKERTVRDIAAQLGCSTALVLRALERKGIDRRHTQVCAEKLKDQNWLEREYVDKQRSGPDIAKELGCSKYAVYRALKRHDISARQRTNKRPILEDKPWIPLNAGGHTIHSGSGYVYVHAPGHPNATANGYVMEHRLVMRN